MNLILNNTPVHISNEKLSRLDILNVDMQAQKSPWLHTFKTCKQAKIKLYCFAYAGGNANIFSKWPNVFGDDVEVCAISLPGRWERMNEPSITCMNNLCWEIANAVLAESKIPFVFFGHSMGAILLFEVARQLRKQGAMTPEHLFVSGAQAPHTLNEPSVNRRKKICDMDDDELMGYLQLLSGTPSELLQDREMREYVIKIMTPDLQAIDGWQYRQTKPLTQNISVFVGDKDPVIDLAAARAWKQHTLNNCELNVIVGDHFFIHSQFNLLTSKIKRILELETLI